MGVGRTRTSSTCIELGKEILGIRTLSDRREPEGGLRHLAPQSSLGPAATPPPAPRRAGGVRKGVGHAAGRWQRWRKEAALEELMLLASLAEKAEAR